MLVPARIVRSAVSLCGGCCPNLKVVAEHLINCCNVIVRLQISFTISMTNRNKLSCAGAEKL